MEACVRPLYDVYDQDGDGLVSMEEFIGCQTILQNSLGLKSKVSLETSLKVFFSKPWWRRFWKSQLEVLFGTSAWHFGILGRHYDTISHFDPPPQWSATPSDSLVRSTKIPWFSTDVTGIELGVSWQCTRYVMKSRLSWVSHLVSYLRHWIITG